MTLALAAISQTKHTPLPIDAGLSFWGPQTGPPPPRPSPQIPDNSLDNPELRYRLLQHFGDVLICHGVPYEHDVRPDVIFPPIQRDLIAFQLILRRLGMTELREFSDSQKLQVYYEYRKLSLIQLERQALKFRFGMSIVDPQHSAAGARAFRVEGLIDPQGEITELKRQPISHPCPLRCLAGATRIDTPTGSIAVKDLKPGVLVWTYDAKAQRVAMPVVRTSAVPVPRDHLMVHLVLSDGRELVVSPAHPTFNGNTVGQLKQNSIYDGSQIVRTELTPYAEDYTYDLLPAGDTGLYWANGILLGSTLK